MIMTIIVMVMIIITITMMDEGYYDYDEGGYDYDENDYDYNVDSAQLVLKFLLFCCFFRGEVVVYKCSQVIF